jgi:hypothetical protein
MILAVLGRQPALGLAELESLFGGSAVMPVGVGLAKITKLADINTFKRCGSVIKFAETLNYTQDYNLSKLESYIFNVITSENNPVEPGKLTIGISDYSNKITLNELTRIGLSVKKLLKNQGYSVRIVPNKTPHISTAQILHNGLLGGRGYEFVVFNDLGKLQVARTIYEQDIEAYTARDQARPMRDARVGMLPPKLAQTIINLATSPITNNESQYSLSNIQNSTLLDPFCGTGVILQEAALMGYKVYGSDLEARMVSYSKDNMEWLKQKFNINFDYNLEIADATAHKWKQPFNYIAAETYLGRPLSSLPNSQDLNKIIQDVNTLHKKFLQNLRNQISSDTKICLAVPAWNTNRGFLHLPILDQLSNLGYNRIEFQHSKTNDLVYARPDQIVGRELVVLQTK